MHEQILNYIKHKNKMRIIKIIMFASFIVFGGVISSLLFFNGDIPLPAEATSLTTEIKEPPLNSSPSKESAIDNLSYLAYNIKKKRNFTATSTGTASASIMGIPYVQNINDKRVVLDDYMFQQTISTSTFVSFGLQKFYFGDKIIRREGNLEDSSTINWNENPKDAITYKLADEIYGWTPDDISAYILCKDTILSAEWINSGTDGIYEIKYRLDPTTSPYKYQRQVKEFAGASSFPGYEAIEITYKFTSDWTLISSHTNESYKISMMGMNLSITTDINEVFNYDDIKIEEYNYFKNYQNMETIGEKEEASIDAQSLFISAFKDLLNGKTAKYSVILTINDNIYNIDLSLSLIKKQYYVLINDELYISITDNELILINYNDLHLKYNLENIDDLKQSISFFTNYFNINNKFDELDINSLLADLLSSKVELVDNYAIMKTTLKIALFSIDFDFNFIKENDTYNLNYIEAKTTISDINISAKMTSSNKDITFDNNFEYQDINNLAFLLKEVEKLLSDEMINLDLSYKTNVNNKNLDLIINANHIINSKLANGNIIINYDNNRYDLSFYYYENIIYVSYDNKYYSINFNELKTTLEELEINDSNIDELKELLLNKLNTIDVKSIINSIKLDTNLLSLKLLIDNNEYNLSIIKNDTLDINLNDNLKIIIYSSKSNEIKIPEEAIDLTSLTSIYKFININKDSSYKLTINSTLNVCDTLIDLDGNMYVNNDLSLIGELNIIILDYKLSAKVIYKDNDLYFTILNNNIKLSTNDLLKMLPNNIDFYSILDILFSINFNVESYENKLLINGNLKNKSFEINNFNVIAEPNEYTNILVPTSCLNYDDLKIIIDNIKNIIDVINNDTFKLDIITNINDYDITLRGLFDITNNKFNIDLSTIINDVELKLNIKYINEYFYINYANIYIKLNIDEFKTIINRYITINNDIDIISIISTLVVSTSNNDINLGINLSSLIDDLSILLTINPTKEEINGSINDITINDININNTNIKIAKCDQFDVVLNETYLNIDDINEVLNIVDKILDVINDKKFSLNLSLEVNVSDIKVDLVIDIYFNLTDNCISGVISVAVVGTSHEIKFNYINNVLTLSYGNIVVKLSNNEISELIDYVKNKFELKTDINITSSDIISIINSLIIDIKTNNVNISCNLSSVINELSNITLSIFNDSNIKFNLDDLTISNINITNISGYISNEYEDISITGDALTYDDLVNLIDNIYDIINLTKQDRYNINFSTTIYNNDIARYNASANVYVIVNKDGSFDLSVKLDIISLNDVDNNYTIDFSIIDDYCYCSIKLSRRDDSNYDYLNLKCSINDGLSILGTLTKFMGYDIPLLDKFISSNLETLNKDSLGFLIPDKSEVEGIDFSSYLKKLLVNNSSINVIIDGKKLFNSSDDLEIIIGKLNSDGVNYLKIYNIYSKNEIDNVEKFNMDFKLINDNDFTIKVDSNKEYIDISTLNDLLTAFINTASLNDFNITGTFNIKAVIGVSINMDIDYEVIVKLDNNKKPIIIIKFINIPVITGVNNDVPYLFGDNVKGIYPGLNRNLTLYIKDNKIYLYRSEEIPRFASSNHIYEKKLMTSVDNFLDDFYYYLLQVGFGFSSSIISSMKEGMGTGNKNIDLANVINGYNKSDDGIFSLSVSLSELLGNSDLGDINITISTTTLNEKNYLSKFTLSMDVDVSILTLKMSTTNTTLNDILGSVDISELDNYINSYSYGMDEYYTARESEWKLDSNITYELKFVLNNGSDDIIKTYKYEDVIEYIEYDIMLIDSIYKKFVGWYQDSEFRKLYDSTTMPRGDMILYAKWEEVSCGTINFITPYGETPDSIYLPLGYSYTLPTFTFVEVDGKTYKFLYWALDGKEYTNTIMSSSLTLTAVFEYVEYVIYYNDSFINDTTSNINNSWYIKSDDDILKIYSNNTFAYILENYKELGLYNEELNKYIIYVYSYDYDVSNYYYVLYNVSTSYINDNYIGNLYKNNIIFDYNNIPYYYNSIYEVNAWFLTSTLDKDSLVTTDAKISTNTILYPYYSTKISLLNISNDTIYGFSGSSVDTLIIPIYNGSTIITTISKSAFEKCAIKTLVISDFITTILSDAFKSTSLTSLYMSRYVTSVSTDAFYMSSESNAKNIMYYCNGNSNINLNSLLAYKGGILKKSYYYSSISNFTNPKAYDLVSVINSIVL